MIKKSYLGRNRLLKLIAIMLVVMIVLVSCQFNSTEVFRKGSSKFSDISSSNFNSKIELKLDVAKNSKIKWLSDILKASTLEVTGTYEEKGLIEGTLLIRPEVILGIRANIEVPVMMTTEKLWLKVPTLNMIESKFINIPKKIRGKYVEINLNSVHLEGLQLNWWEKFKLNIALANMFYNPISSKRNFTDVDVNNLEIPGDVKIEKAMKFTINDRNKNSQVVHALENALEESFSVVANQQTVNIEKIRKFEFTGGLNANDYLAFQKLDVDMSLLVGQNNEKIDLRLKGTNALSKINKVKTNITIPKETITAKEFLEAMDAK